MKDVSHFLLLSLSNSVFEFRNAISWSAIVDKGERCAPGFWFIAAERLRLTGLDRV